MIKRGDVYYIVKKNDVCDSEQRAGRPAVVVSNDKANEHSDVVEVVYLTSKYKKPMPTHVPVTSTSRNSIALCEQISSVSVNRLGDFLCRCTDDEMQVIDYALAISVGLCPCP